jgi:hypothetical protein
LPNVPETTAFYKGALLLPIPRIEPAMEMLSLALKVYFAT